MTQLASMADDQTFSKLPDDVVLQILFSLEDDPRNWARLSCVSKKFSSIISNICCKSKCLSIFPSISADLLSLSSTSSSSSSSSSSPPGGWASLYKLAVCCPGLIRAGVLLDNSDFGLHRELGADTDYVPVSAPLCSAFKNSSHQYNTPISHGKQSGQLSCEGGNSNSNSNNDEGHHLGGWSLYDDLYFDTVYNNSESMDVMLPSTVNSDTKFVVTDDNESKRRKVTKRPHRSHLASGAWNLSREQGNKLLASRFRGDCLYICDWPGCVHIEEKRNYMLFRGFFKNFKRSRVWRTINDGNRSKIELNCAFCSCKETWDLHSAFCLKRGFGFHDDGEPVVRAYVCENGHVSGAWTDLPLYT